MDFGIKAFLSALLFVSPIFCADLQEKKVSPIDFRVYDMPTQHSNGVLALIMSGIQGDEPGAYNATNILLQYYTIKKGSVRVVPSLSPHSMFFNNRGVFGDLNRKFATLHSNDPEYSVIQKIKAEILKPDVSAIFHMHDGSGFYREEYVDEMFGPRRWGNCSIIDQDFINVEPFGNLHDIIDKVVQHTNKGLLKPFHKYHIRNTHTAIKDLAMQKSLTYFAITNNKPAFAHEASKTLPLREKTYYHLLGIEGFLNALGIEFERHFELNPQNVAKLINDTSITMSIQSRIQIPIFGLKSPLNYFPMPLNAKRNLQDIPLDSKSYILGLAHTSNNTLIDIKYGNRTMGRLKPLYLDFDTSLLSVQMLLDNEEREVAIGSMVRTKESFFIKSKEGYRANVIGFVKAGDTSNKPQEFDTLVQKGKMQKRFSIDNAEKMYRVEFYKGEAFAGMIVVEFE